MRNPWLEIPLHDYEAHMNAPRVAQLSALADLFEEALAQSHPESVAILGIAGGNGLERVDITVTKRIVAVDINPTYLNAVRERHPKLPLKPVCVDLTKETVNEEGVQLVHAALIFEHTGIDESLRNAASLVAADGHLSVVLQLPSTEEADVSQTPVQSIQTLSDHFKIVDRARLGTALKMMGFNLCNERKCDVPAGKAFWLGIFKRSRCSD